MIKINMVKARNIHRQKLREMREPKLAALDVEMLQAIEDGDMTRRDAIKAKKQALRDVTEDPAIGKAKTPEKLKAVIPAALIE
jgi:hypothetical protein